MIKFKKWFDKNKLKLNIKKNNTINKFFDNKRYINRK